MPADPLDPTLVRLIQDMFVCPQTEIRRDTVPDDIDGWDSLSHAVLLLRIERAFRITLDRAETLEVEDVGELSDLVVRLAAPKPGLKPGQEPAIRAG